MVALDNGIYIFLVTFVLQLLFYGIFEYSCKCEYRQLSLVVQEASVDFVTVCSA